MKRPCCRPGSPKAAPNPLQTTGTLSFAAIANSGLRPAEALTVRQPEGVRGLLLQFCASNVVILPSRFPAYCSRSMCYRKCSAHMRPLTNMLQTCVCEPFKLLPCAYTAAVPASIVWQLASK